MASAARFDFPCRKMIMMLNSSASDVEFFDEKTPAKCALRRKDQGVGVYSVDLFHREPQLERILC